jgi:hypothetical protein
MEQRNLNLLLIAATTITGALLSGYLAREGAIAAGHDPRAPYPFPDLTGFSIFVFGALACPLLAFLLVKPLKRIFSSPSYRGIFATLIIPAIIAFPTGTAIYRLRVRNLAFDSAKDEELRQIQQTKSTALQVRLIADPEIALRERWFKWEKGDETLRYLFMESLKSAVVPYSTDQLKRIYQEAPEARTLVVAHPACEPTILVDFWNHALAEPEADNYQILIAIASNPKTPRALLENLESSTDGKLPAQLKQGLDARLYGEKLVMLPDQHIHAITEIGPIKLYASSDLGRSCEWKSATRSATLESRRENSPDGPILNFYGSNEDRGEDRGEANVTKRIEFREGRKNFHGLDQATLWIRQQSAQIPTVYRNDGLLVSSDMDARKNQLTIEIWQILIGANKPTSLPGSDDTKLIVTPQL